MKQLLLSLLFLIVCSTTFAVPSGPPSVPEIDGALSIQVLVLVGGLILLFKKKKK